MAGPAKGRVLGKRRHRSTAAEEQEHVEPLRASKRFRKKREASARQTYPEPSTTTIRNGLATPEPSSSTESQTSLLADDTPLDRKDIFPFMQLPAELRIHIYYMALHRDLPLFLHAERDPQEDPEHACTYFEDLEEDLEEDLGQETTYLDTDSRPRPINDMCKHANSLPPDMTPLLDPIVPTILRLNRQVYKEARPVLYSANTFALSLRSGTHTLSTLHQRSRSLIKHVVLAIPSHHDILDGFADLLRLGLRYCWGLETFKIILQARLPEDGSMVLGKSVHANAFRILRWLPRGCKVVLEGRVSEQVMQVVREEGRLHNELDEAEYAKRQHQLRVGEEYINSL